MNPPKHATDYTPEQLARTRRTLLQVLAVIGDFRDDVVLVGGLVPSLLIDQAEAQAREDAHVGTADVDLGLRLAVVSERRYDELAERLRESGFGPDVNRKGNPTAQRWRYGNGDGSVVIDFLIDETETEDHDWDRLLNMTDDLAAIRALGLGLAFDDAELRSLSGETLQGDTVERDVRVCGPAAFVVLKALASLNRGQEKDAYDLIYVVRNWPGGPGDIAARWRGFGGHPAARKALKVLGDDFASEAAVGPRRASRFLYQTRGRRVRRRRRGRRDPARRPDRAAGGRMSKNAVSGLVRFEATGTVARPAGPGRAGGDNGAVDASEDEPIVERAEAMAAALPEHLNVRQAAELLFVDPKYVDGLIDRGEIKTSGTGDARRIDKKDATAWLRRNVALRRQALDELVAETEALGLYDEPPPRRPETDMGR